VQWVRIFLFLLLCSTAFAQTFQPIPQAFCTCVQTPPSPNQDVTCTLPSGYYEIGNETANASSCAVAYPWVHVTASGTAAHPLVIEGSQSTLRRRAGYNGLAGSNTDAYDPLLFVDNAQWVTVRNFTFNGNRVALGLQSTLQIDLAADVQATTVIVNSTATFPGSGVIRIDNEIMRYSGTTSTNFTGVVRMQAGL
jgi:hypothetical protein